VFSFVETILAAAGKSAKTFKTGQDKRTLTYFSNYIIFFINSIIFRQKKQANMYTIFKLSIYLDKYMKYKLRSYEMLILPAQKQPDGFNIKHISLQVIAYYCSSI